MRVTVTFADMTSQYFDLADGSIVDNLRYDLITRSTSPLLGRTGSFQAVHLAYYADQTTALGGGVAIVQDGAYYADLPVCTVCQELVTGDRFITPCRHWFHRSHLARWVGQGKRVCPNCRADLANSMHNVSVYNSAGVQLGQATNATYALDFASVTLTDFTVMSNDIDPNNRYTIYAEYIATVPADHAYQLPAMTALIDPNEFAVPMTFTRAV